MIAALVQARTGSERLPGKVLLPICGEPMLARLLARLGRARRLDEIVLVTTDRPGDDAIEELGRRLGLAVFRGSESDVLDRFYKAAQAHGVDVIVRVCGDCPLMDPGLIDLMVETYFRLREKVDYVANVHPPTYPDGLDLWVFTFSSLARAWREATKRSEREHVTPYIYNHPEFFRIHNVANEVDLSHWRWTVDYPHDFALVSAVFEHFHSRGQKEFGFTDVIAFLESRPDLAALNKGSQRDGGYLKSLALDGT